MRPFGAWFGRVAMAGSCLAWAGCGGGDVPDPDSDSTAAAEAPARVVDRAGPQAPAEAPAAADPAKPEPAAPAREEPAAAVASNPPPAEAPEATPAQEPEKAAATVKGDASGTEDMLRIAATPAQDPAAAETPAAAGNPGGGIPGGASGMPGRPGMAGAGRRDGEAGTPNLPAGNPQSMPGGGPGGPAGPENFAAMRPGMPGGASIPGGQGMPGGPGGFGGPGSLGDPGGSAPVGPNTFNHAGTAVQAFLTALKLKDKDRLAQATARRAATEAVEKHRKVFEEIIVGNISDDELDEMSKAMAGYQVSQILPAKSSGRISVVVSKREGPDTRQRTITVRKEQDLWKVMDISDALLFKAQGIMRARRP